MHAEWRTGGLVVLIAAVVVVAVVGVVALTAGDDAVDRHQLTSTSITQTATTSRHFGHPSTGDHAPPLPTAPPNYTTTVQ
jgi:hypothetical protein